MISPWPIIENIFTLLLACGLSTGFFYFTGSAHSFWWMLLLFNINFPQKKTP